MIESRARVAGSLMCVACCLVCLSELQSTLADTAVLPSHPLPRSRTRDLIPKTPEDPQPVTGRGEGHAAAVAPPSPSVPAPPSAGRTDHDADEMSLQIFANLRDIIKGFIGSTVTKGSLNTLDEVANDLRRQLASDIEYGYEYHWTVIIWYDEELPDDIIGSAGDSSWSHISNGCNAPIPPDACIDAGAILEAGIRSRADAYTTKSTMVMWRLPGVQDFAFTRAELPELSRTVLYCVTMRGSPLDLNKAGDCLLEKGLSRDSPYTPKSILLVPYTSCGFAASRGGIFVVLNERPPEQADLPRLPPVFVFMLK